MTRAGRGEDSVKKGDSATPPPENRRPRKSKNDTRRELFILQDTARRLIPEQKGICKCGRALTYGSTLVPVLLNPADDDGRRKARFGNLFRCSSVWLCAVCARTIAAKRRDELRELLERSQKMKVILTKNGYKKSEDLTTGKKVDIVFLTLTVPHYAGQLARDLIEKITEARRKLYNRKEWKRIKKELGLIGSVRSLEVTIGKNGYHIHTHEILFIEREENGVSKIFGKEDTDEAINNRLSIGQLLRLKNEKDKYKKNEAYKKLHSLSYWERISAEWASACLSAGLSCPDAHGVTIHPGEKAAEYATKWGLAFELTGSQTKSSGGLGDHRKGKTPWELLWSAHKGDEEAGKLWEQYAYAFKGRRQLVFSKGLAALFGAAIIPEDQQIIDLEEEAPAELLGTIEKETWYHLCLDRKRADVLEAAEKGGWKAVVAFVRAELPGLFIEGESPGKDSG